MGSAGVAHGFERDDDGRGAILDAELVEDALQVLLGGETADAEDDPDLGVGFALGEPAEDFGLAAREPGAHQCGGGIRGCGAFEEDDGELALCGPDGGDVHADRRGARVIPARAGGVSGAAAVELVEPLFGECGGEGGFAEARAHEGARLVGGAEDAALIVADEPGEELDGVELAASGEAAGVARDECLGGGIEVASDGVEDLGLVLCECDVGGAGDLEAVTEAAGCEVTEEAPDASGLPDLFVERGAFELFGGLELGGAGGTIEQEAEPVGVDGVFVGVVEEVGGVAVPVGGVAGV